MTDETVAALAQRIEHDFADPDLFAAALTHPSSGAAAAGPSKYERLEFLGDRVLALVIAEMLLYRYPDEDEGALSRRLVGLVRRESLIRVAEAIELDRSMRMAPPPTSGIDQARATVLADGCEALIGALYLDGGIEAAARFIRRWWRPLVEAAIEPPRDAKTALQEWAQGHGLPLPVYSTVARQGPAHQPSFTVDVAIADDRSATGQGPSKRTAEQAAAAALLERLLHDQR